MLGFKYKLLSELCTPTRATDGSAAYDLRANIPFNMDVYPGGWANIPFGIRTEFPNGFVALIFARSGLGGAGFSLRNAVGVVDSDYRGEWMGQFINNHDSNVPTIKPGDRIAQFIVIKHEELELIQTDDLEISERGGNGFGSSGV